MLRAHAGVLGGDGACGLGATVEQHLAGAIARDLYNAVPETERPDLHTAFAAKLDPITAAAFECDPQATTNNPANTTELLSTLAETGHLTPQTAADLGITKQHLKPCRTQLEPVTTDASSSTNFGFDGPYIWNAVAPDPNCQLGPQLI